MVSAGSGALKKVIFDDVRALHAFVADSTPLFVKTLAAPVLGTVVMLAIDWRMTFVALSVFPIALIGLRVVGRAVAMVVGIGGLATPGFAARLPRRIELPCARNALPGGVEARNRCRLVGVMVITDTCMGAA
ncbi:ABC transporter transmembrane domain-containing protein [Streptomyces parvus]|uniref:ABC transporter transmembrane domain-containing protein n=1 Tax=Streptomyces parvus TaxID=66428 RepID=UPI00371EF772